MMRPHFYPTIVVAIFSAALLLLKPGICAAEDPHPVSWAAENAAIQRAVAAMHPDPKVRCPDNLAHHFVTEANWHYSPYSRDYRRSIKMIKTYRIGAYYYANALAHHLDEALKDAPAAGIRQVVNLRAGFDTHAYRFHEAMPQVTFFELDAPGTSRLKQEMVRGHLGKLPGHVVFVFFDPATERLGSALKDAGYDDTLKTLFLWTGGTYHLSAGAVEATFDFVAAHSAPGSRMVFDYLTEKMLQDKASRRARFRLALAGEPLTFGIPGEGIAAYLAERGLSVVSDLGWQELQQRYLIGSDGTADGNPSALYRVAVAAVGGPGAGPPKAEASWKPEVDPMASAPLIGTWTGTDSLGGRLVFRFSPDGTLTAERTGGRDPRPKAGTYTRSGTQIDGHMDDIAFSGTAAANRIEGSWRQATMGAEFTLTRNAQKR